MNALVQINTNADAYRASTDAAGLCRDIVKQTAKPIQGRRYVSVEGWQAIAIAHGCAASADHVERVSDDGMSGFKAVGIVRRMSDGQEIARAEGFLGDDESMWTKRPVYARRAMVQTRAISRACRSAFAHVVVMIDAGLSTTPAEEVPQDGFDNGQVIQHSPLKEQLEQSVAQTTGRKQPERLKGPIKTRAELRTACGNLVREIHSCGDLDQFEALLADQKPLIEQVQEEHEFFWLGDGADFLGLQKEINRMRAHLEQEVEGHNEAWRNSALAAG